MMTAAARSQAAKKAWDTIRENKLHPPKPKKQKKLVKQEPIVLPKTQEKVSAKDMMLKTVVLLVTINGIGNYRKVDTDTLNITDANTEKEVNKEWIGVHKKLMNAEELKKIVSIGNKTKAYVFSLALPYSLKSGIYLLPREFQDDMEEKLSGFEAEMKPYIEQLANRLPEYKREAKREQGPQFNEKQFPTADKIRSAFRITWRFLHIDSAQGLSKAVYEKEKAKAEAEWAETSEIVQAALRTALSDMVDHMVDKLTPEDGKRKIFHESSLEKLNQFLVTFDARNITNDAQMKVLVDKAKSLVKDTDAESLRSNEAVRDYVKYGFETIKKLLDPMIVNKPHRAIRLED